ncbi:MAG: WhiB family transcriptional regulator, partial [Acidimicrobiales bacterium]
MDGVVSRVDLLTLDPSFVARAFATTEMPWRRFALCLQFEPELWFSYEPEDGVKAVRVCSECPVRLDCLGWAIAHNEIFGIWGGISARKRTRIRAEMRRKQPSIFGPISSGAGHGNVRGSSDAKAP